MAKNKYLSREDILEADDLAIEEIEVPEWGGTVSVRGLTGQERDDYQIGLMVHPGKSEEINMQNATAKLIALCVVDRDGNPTFREGDALALAKKGGKPMSRVYELAAKLSGLSKDDMKDLTANLTIGQNGDSTSA